MGIRETIRTYKLRKSTSMIDFCFTDYLGFEELKKVAIMWQSGKGDVDLLTFAKMLRDYNKEVHLLAYLPVKRKDLKIVPTFDHFVKNELNWYGRPRGDVVTNFLARHYEVCICLGVEEASPLEFIVQQLRTDFKLGNIKNPSLEYHLLIQSGKEKSTEKVLRETSYYLNFINSSKIR